MPRDFAANQGAKTQEYLVYFKFLQRRVAAKDSESAEDDIVRCCHKKSYQRKRSSFPPYINKAHEKALVPNFLSIRLCKWVLCYLRDLTGTGHDNRIIGLLLSRVRRSEGLVILRGLQRLHVSALRTRKLQKRQKWWRHFLPPPLLTKNVSIPRKDEQFLDAYGWIEGEGNRGSFRRNNSAGSSLYS